MSIPQSTNLKPRALPYTRNALWLISLLALLAGCSPSRKKEAQDLARLGSATSQKLADYYDGLVKQNQDFLSLYAWQKATDGTATSVPALYRFVRGDFEAGGKPFVLRLKNGSDPFAAYVRNHLPDTARKVVRQYNGALTSQDLNTLRGGINEKLLTDTALLNDERKAFLDDRGKRLRQQMTDLQDTIRKLEQDIRARRDPEERLQLDARLKAATTEANKLAPIALRYQVAETLIASAAASDAVKTKADEDPDAGVAAGPARDPRRVRLNRLLLDSAFSEELGTSVVETFAIQNELLSERAELARTLKDLYDSLGDLVDYDASGEVKSAASALQKQIETVNHHPLDLGAIQPLSPKSAFGDLASRIAQAQQTREVRKNAPLVQEVLHAVRTIFDSEKEIYIQISERYFSESKLIAIGLVEGKRDVSGLSFLQTAIDPYNLRLLKRVAEDPQTIDALSELIAEKTDEQKLAARAGAEKMSKSLKRVDDAHNAFMNKNKADRGGK